jgi:hypothetical protein
VAIDPDELVVLASHLHIGDVIVPRDVYPGEVTQMNVRPHLVDVLLRDGRWVTLPARELVRVLHRPW